ncbi:cell growth-regulating nucleolar protein isoform X1 [Alligator sinensis]|uniref:Cell growth-regulating nucleolar protein isoform X1 n=1 Tax=Alligator sinensis TaxID=38654 RepID=A0A1U7RM81_ALLSI|nr:cell growth-regulating nucleolar protein isoform X1 [Alligator sinensis]
MVVFTCNACGESVKKGQVEKHVNICRRCQCLSCMDCGKDFWGDDYKNHVKCISEDQKYGGKGYDAKTNKGDVKQQEWIQKIQEVMKKTNINPKVRNILEQIRAYDNIPRKKVKFQNWIKNSLKIENSALQDQVWDIFSEATGNKGTNQKEQEKPEQKTGSKSAKSEVHPTPIGEDETSVDKSEKKKSKKERKEERQKNKKKEKKEMRLENQQNLEMKKSKKSKKENVDMEHKSEETSKIEEKKKKRKRNNTSKLEINGNGYQNEEEVMEPNVKKQKLKHVDDEPFTTKGKKNTNISEAMEYEESEETNKESGNAHKGKFNWKGTIKAILSQAPDNEISIKKLRKKVLAQYHAVAGEHHKTQEDLLVIFNKKVNNNPKFKVLKEKVKLLK